ncbi:MAG TPA: S1/P1 nuclease [Candidatus Binatia bacterium]|nr:S1/P1 nuclease [Candidatus Binatia bacterium]
MARSSSRLILLAFVSTIPLLPTPSLYAWGDGGHEIIGVIAQSRLTPTVKKKVDALLAADKDNLTAPDFVSRATWADKYRDSDRNTTRIRYEATRNWHFVDIELADANIDSACNHYPKLPPGTVASAGPAQDCIINKVNQFIAELRSVKVTTSERILALKFLLHLVGDLHQPLHAADNKDRGGNDVRVVFGDLATPGNLHAYWDGRVVELMGNDPRAVGAALNKQISKANVEEWSKGTPITWARDSFRQAKSVAYNFSGAQQFIDDKGIKTIRLNAAYDNRGVPAAREQLSKAGVRLASVLISGLM